MPPTLSTNLLTELNKRIMNTAILVFILIVIAIAIFYFGLFLGAWTSARRLADATGKAIVDSDLTLDQQSDLLDKIKEYSKQK